MPRFMTAEALALAIGKHPETVRRWCREQQIPAEKDPGGRGWLIKESDFDAIREKYTKKYFDDMYGCN